MKTIGVAGTDGSGKDSLAQMLVERYNWMFISVTDILRDEAKKRGTELSRQSLRQISAEWRREHGLGILINKAVNLFEESRKDEKGLVIASLRNPGEADKVHELDGIVVWIDADPKIRFERIQKRKRGTEDEVNFEQFIAEEKAQSKHSGDEATLSLNDVKEKSDIFLENSGENIEEFKNEAENVLKKYLF